MTVLGVPLGHYGSLFGGPRWVEKMLGVFLSYHHAISQHQNIYLGLLSYSLYKAHVAKSDSRVAPPIAIAQLSLH